MELPSLLFEQHPHPMLIFDTNSLEILEVNQSAVKKYGFNEREFKQLTIEDMRPPEQIHDLREELQKMEGKVGVHRTGRVKHRTRKGKVIHVQICTQPFPVRGRSARIAHIYDFTEKVQLKNKAEEACREQEHLINNNPLGMLKFDKNFQITEWSKRSEEKTGYSKDEVIGKNLFEIGLFERKQTDFVKIKLADITDGSRDKARFETTMRLKKGDPMDVQIHVSALRAEGELKSVLAFIENITERKRYERQLQKREKKYRRLFEEANDGIFLMKDLKFLDCNESISKLFGVPKEKIIGKTPLDFSPEFQPDGKRSEDKAKKIIELVKKGEQQVFEWKHLTADNEPIDIEVSLNKIDLGDQEFIQAILHDLSDHKKFEKKLKEQKRRLENAQELARLGWWSYSVKEGYVIWSEPVFDLIDKKKDSFDNYRKEVFEAVHPEDREMLQKTMEKARSADQPIKCSFRILDDNDLKYVEGRIQSEFDAEGSLVKINGYYQDVTERELIQKKLKKNKELFESLFLDSPIAIAMIDPDGNTLKINKSFESLFKYSKKELIGKDLLEQLLPKERHDEISQKYDRVFAGGGKTRYYRDQRITKNGDVKDLFVAALPVFIDGEPIAAFGIYTDITQLKMTETNLQESLDEKKVLLAEIHHRVKNNLAIISGLLLLEAMNWDDGSEVNKVLMQSKLRIHSMAKIHEKLYESEDFARLNLRDYFEELVSTIFDSMHGVEKNVQLNIDCDDIQLNINQALPCALIVNELVTNAFKYAFERNQNGKLAVNFKERGNKIAVSVTDNGPGLPTNFDEMVEKSLGHRLVQQLVTQLEGDITVESSDKGTKYMITFNRKNGSGSSSHHFH